MKYIRLVDKDGQFSVNTQSLEDFVHLKDSGSHRLFRIHLAARFVLRQVEHSLFQCGDSTLDRHTPCWA